MPANKPAYYPYRTPHGLITIRAVDTGIANVIFGDTEMTGERRPSELLNRAATELMEYFAGKRSVFDLPLAPEGSTFQRAVWTKISGIPYAHTQTPTGLAQLLGNVHACRAVGAAVRKNPLAILIPDHRVVGTQGKPTATGKRAHLHTALLRLEQQNIPQNQEETLR